MLIHTAVGRGGNELKNSGRFWFQQTNTTPILAVNAITMCRVFFYMASNDNVLVRIARVREMENGLKLFKWNFYETLIAIRKSLQFSSTSCAVYLSTQREIFIYRN